MPTIPEIISAWADGRPNFSRATNVSVTPDGLNLFSYNATIAVMAPGRAFALLNGDIYSHTTSKHQSLVRVAIRKAGVPSITLPFTAMRSARINRDSIVPLEVRPETWAEETIITREKPSEKYTYNVRQLEDGRWSHTRMRHWLGASLFEANVDPNDHTGTRRMKFLSAFDEQEPHPLYFLCALPPTTATTIAEALEVLKPEEVKRAEAEGATTYRQGDIFAVPVDGNPVKEFGLEVRPRSLLLNTNHNATRVARHKREDGNVDTYASGCLYHSPIGRRPDHARRKLGDGKQWFRIIKNTVPIDPDTLRSRSWGHGGNVD